MDAPLKQLQSLLGERSSVLDTPAPTRAAPAPVPEPDHGEDDHVPQAGHQYVQGWASEPALRAPARESVKKARAGHQAYWARMRVHWAENQRRELRTRRLSLAFWLRRLKTPGSLVKAAIVIGKAPMVIVWQVRPDGQPVPESMSWTGCDTLTPGRSGTLRTALSRVVTGEQSPGRHAYDAEVAQRTFTVARTASAYEYQQLGSLTEHWERKDVKKPRKKKEALI